MNYKVRTYDRLNFLIRKEYPRLSVRKTWSGIKLFSNDKSEQEKIEKLTPAVGCNMFGVSAVNAWTVQQWLDAIKRKVETLN